MSKKVHFVLDEAAALGHMPALDDAVDKFRGYGVRLIFAYKSMGQLKNCWPADEGQTLMSNTTKIFFGTNDYKTAEFLSKSLGPATILVEDGSSNKGWSRSQSHGASSANSQSSNSTSGGNSSNWKQQSRELLKPDEVIALNTRIAITLTPGVRPIWTRLIRYHEEPALFKRRGWLMRLAAAVWTLFISTALLVFAAVAAAAMTSELNDVIKQQRPQPMPAATYPPQPWLTPR